MDTEVPMYFTQVLCLCLTSAEPSWATDYDQAVQTARKHKKDLVILFQGNGELEDVMRNGDVRKRLRNFVCLKLPVTHKYNDKPLLEYAALEDMMGKPGLAI